MTENEISYKIRGAIYTVYKELGAGLLESVYEEALCFELSQQGMKVARQVELPVIYKGVRLNHTLRLDIVVEDKVIIELKSVSDMKDVYYKQLLTYLKLSGLKLGILVNFNTDNIIRNGIFRIVNGL